MNNVYYIIFFILVLIIFIYYNKESFVNYYGTSCYLSCINDNGEYINSSGSAPAQCTLCGADNETNCKKKLESYKITLPNLLVQISPGTSNKPPTYSYNPLVCEKSPIPWLV